MSQSFDTKGQKFNCINFIEMNFITQQMLQNWKLNAVSNKIKLDFDHKKGYFFF